VNGLKNKVFQKGVQFFILSIGIVLDIGKRRQVLGVIQLVLHGQEYGTGKRIGKLVPGTYFLNDGSD
jgi:hypothetical protein